MNIGLTGMPGTMKSATGRALAALTGMTLVDTDEVIEREEGRSISEIFAEGGEARFRDLESEVIARECARDGAIISFGGGAVIRAVNRERIKKSCFCVRLTATAECIARRCCGDSRPLLLGDTLARVRQLAAEREEFYADCADMTVDTTDMGPDRAAKEILSAFEKASTSGK